MTKKFLSICIEPERLLGWCMKALNKGEKLNITASENESQTPNSPDYLNNQQGISIWIKDSKFE